ncbi:Small kinetochore-associated protein [Camelus dromedarius]|uniref:Small kinetochore-associated protein n=1 Tax=Camelus dromedarius TaxID=9838 RepID=A0A5N4E3W3_CAMDR|nr:Small kinetochore-associated protein [Camelus dromedarius]
MTPVAHSSIEAGKVHHSSPPPRPGGRPHGLPGSLSSLLGSDLPYSMAAPKGVAQGSDFRTTWPPTESAPHPLPPGHRKFPFETLAADAVGGTAVAAEHFLNQSDEAWGPQRQAPGFGSPAGVGTVLDVGGRWGGLGREDFLSLKASPEPGQVASRSPGALCLLGPPGPVLGNVHLVPSRARPCRLVTMTSVVKTVYTLQPPSVLSSGLPPGFELMHKLERLLRAYYLLSPKKLMFPDFIQEVQRMIQKSSNRDERMELKDKNQLLEAVNKQLHQKLTETQGELKDLTQKVELLEKFQNNCLAILESKGLNPGSETLTSQQISTTDHMDSMLLLETLQDELKLFNETAKKQMEELQALKVKLKMKEEERAQFLEQQTLYNSQVNNFTTALDEMEQLLEM